MRATRLRGSLPNGGPPPPGLSPPSPKISALQAELATLQQAVEAAEARLVSQQAPAASLVAGLVNMGRRPPYLSLANSGSLSEVVRVRMLLDSNLPSSEPEPPPG